MVPSGRRSSCITVARVPTVVEIIRLGVFLGAILLGDQKDIGLLLHGVLQGLDRPLPAHHQRGYHVGKNHDIPQRHQG
jgi:hypothetical protein